ncbi:MAG: long-chain fatty acid--CoA ligase, partial [Planctomycetaceae bacterium]|nr:long-chain fatty acid--CoA ligase [Planctomycetaceae bacterium]
GDLILCGRSDDMIVSGGENVYPVELENILVEHPAVAMVVVVGIPDQEFGQRLKAFVQVLPGEQTDQEQLLSWLRPRVARHQMPAMIEIREELPATSLGKPDRKALRQSAVP